jgi:hypothetical protein
MFDFVVTRLILFSGCSPHNITYIELNNYEYSGGGSEVTASNKDDCKAKCTQSIDCMVYQFDDGFFKNCYLTSPQPYWKLFNFIDAQAQNQYLGIKQGCTA